MDENSWNFSSFPKFTLEEVVLRELSYDDAEDYLNYITHSKVARFIAECDLPRNIEQANEEISYWKQLFHRKLAIYWAVALKNNNKLIGTCGFNHINLFHRRGEISYDLSISHQGKGLMQAALNAVCAFAFDNVGLQRIQATTVVSNTASSKLLERLGFEREGLLKKYGKLNGKHRDYYMYSLTK